MTQPEELIYDEPAITNLMVENIESGLAVLSALIGHHVTDDISPKGTVIQTPKGELHVYNWMATRHPAEWVERTSELMLMPTRLATDPNQPPIVIFSPLQGDFKRKECRTCPTRLTFMSSLAIAAEETEHGDYDLLVVRGRRCESFAHGFIQAGEVSWKVTNPA